MDTKENALALAIEWRREKKNYLQIFINKRLKEL
jgi:hypothetical protein